VCVKLHDTWQVSSSSSSSTVKPLAPC
jgi:hypothetical protein